MTKITINQIELELPEKEALALIEKYQKPEFEYPVFKRGKLSGVIVKFTELTKGTAVWSGTSKDVIGQEDNDWISHTEKDTWQDIAYDAERDLFDGQPVYCWDKVTHYKAIRFYDAISNKVFSMHGKRRDVVYQNYEAIKPEHYTPWMLQAFETLERG